MLLDGVSLKMSADSSSVVRVEEVFRVPYAVGYEGGHSLGSFAVYLVTKARHSPRNE
jgi:hypothetical protein